jgi:hypothetical protein
MPYDSHGIKRAAVSSSMSAKMGTELFQGRGHVDRPGGDVDTALVGNEVAFVSKWLYKYETENRLEGDHAFLIFIAKGLDQFTGASTFLAEPLQGS